MLGGHGALLAEMYPTEIRATAQNVIFNIGRAIGGSAPVVIALLAGSLGFGFALALLPTIYVIQLLAMFLLPEKRGAELEGFAAGSAAARRRRCRPPVTRPPAGDEL